MHDRLTQLTSGAGCAVKYPPDQLLELLGTSTAQSGIWLGDDAATIAVDGMRRLVHTVDVITPVVDDAYTWGFIAAIHAMSDIYAVGGRPISALNILGWPRTLDVAVAREVLRGGYEACIREGCDVSGGHTYYDEEPKFGLAVLGRGLDPRFSLDAGKPGDSLVLTKPLGTGVLTAMHVATGEEIPEAVQNMLVSNATSARNAASAGARCATDVSGFGLVGQAIQIANRSNVTVVLDSEAIPLLVGAREAANAGYLPGGTIRNLLWANRFVLWDEKVSHTTRLLLSDSQTSGGLLVAGAEIQGWPVGTLERRGNSGVCVE